jgi:hypothetical protein
MTTGRLPPLSVAGQQPEFFQISTAAATATAVNFALLTVTCLRITIRRSDRSSRLRGETNVVKKDQPEAGRIW